MADRRRVELLRLFPTRLISNQFSSPFDLPIHYLEHRAGFEPAVLLVCNQFPWAARASVHVVLSTGIDPVSLDYQSSALPLS